MANPTPASNTENGAATNVTDFVPTAGSEAIPPMKIQDFLNQTAIIHGGKVITRRTSDDGQREFKSATIDMTVETDNIRRNVSSSSIAVATAIEDMERRSLFPCRVLVAEKGKAFYFATPPKRE